MTIEYFYTRQSTGFLDIEDMGNCFIECYNDKGERFYIWTKTSYGKTTILTQDFTQEEGIPLEESTLSLKTIPYNMLKLKTFISNFINTPQYKITQATVLNIENSEKEEKFVNLTNIMKNIKTRTDDEE